MVEQYQSQVSEAAKRCAFSCWLFLLMHFDDKKLLFLSCDASANSVIYPTDRLHVTITVISRAGLFPV